MAEVVVTVHFDVGLDLKTAKRLPCGSTVADLKAALAREDPTGQARPEDFQLARFGQAANGSGPALGDGEVLTEALRELVVWDSEGEGAEEDDDASAVLQPPEDAVGSACEYLVVQGGLFKKPGADPTTAKVVRMRRKVGSRLQTTGRTWSGPAGGEWVELAGAGESQGGGGGGGWVLVEGPGFGITGPLLLRVPSAEAPPAFVVRAGKPVAAACVNAEDVEHSDFLVHPDMKVGVAKRIIAGLFELEAKQIVMAKPIGPATQTAGNVDVMTKEQLLEDHATMGEAGFREGDEVPFIYKGRLPESYYPSSGTA